jgi:hypothetical protein
MIRATLSNALHGVGHGFEWAATKSHKAADQVLTWPKWMDFKTDEAVETIRAWGAQQEAVYQARMRAAEAAQKAATNGSRA